MQGKEVSWSCILNLSLAFSLKVSNKAVEEFEFMKAIQKRSSVTQKSIEENLVGFILGLKY